MATGIWQNPDVVAKLCAALRHLTGDQWSFDFKAAGNKAPIGERQIPLGFANSKKFAVPYSEGLDSRAVSALSGTEDDALCVRVSNNRQKRRSEEHTSELQSLMRISYAVFCLKKKKEKTAL